jgi:hypothetical protein
VQKEWRVFSVPLHRELKKGTLIGILKQAEIEVEDYPDDTPYPSGLVSGTVNHRPIHVVMAYNNVDREAIVITAYEPDPDVWSENFSMRSRS